MELQMRAERERRAAVTNAEASKRAQILEAEGMREAQVRRAEGEKEAAILRADGLAKARLAMAEAEAEAQRAGRALVDAGAGPSAVDALVATVAAAFGDVVLTSDPGDFAKLTRHFRGLRILGV